VFFSSLLTLDKKHEETTYIYLGALASTSSGLILSCCFLILAKKKVHETARDFSA
jgi:hypothetical protein